MSALVGQGIERVDGRAKVTGGAVYACDTRVANVAHAVIVGSTISRGKVAAIDVRAAAAVSSVLGILTHENAQRLPGWSPKPSADSRVVQPLQAPDVLYDGQPVALVVAETLEVARHAASLVAVTYDEARAAIAFAAEASNAFAPEERPPLGKPDTKRGDPEAAFAKAPVRMSQTYTTSIQTHHPMELHGTIAVWQGDDALTLYDTTQGVFVVKKRMAQLFGISADNVRVISRYLGGGFGSKGAPWSHVPLAALAARQLGRPVKLVLDRQQMFHFVGHRPLTSQKVSLGAGPDGKLRSVAHHVISHTSRFDQFVEPAAKQTRMLYACRDVATSHQLVRLDTSTPTFTRAPGEASGSFALESAMDELAVLLRMDPLELRLRNHAERDMDEDKPFSSKSLEACYKAGAERFGWAKRKMDPRATRNGDILSGWGMATAAYPANQRAASALARLDKEGNVVVQSASHDLGTGTYTIMAQLAADTLGLPMSRVRFELGDTALPEAPLSAGSSTAASVGSAVKRATTALRDKLAALATADSRSPIHGAKSGDWLTKEGALVSKRDPSKSDSFVEILKRNGLTQLEERADSDVGEARKKHSCWAFGAHFVEVNVDEPTGEVRVARMVGAFACGKILNARTARSQFLGGMVWGIGLALLEHTQRDQRTARVVTRDLVDYHVPVNADVGDLDVIMVDENDPHVNEIGVKGAGEIGITGAAAAIANAVYHATGKRIRDLPITPDKLR